jgi:hypothetical protein
MQRHCSYNAQPMGLQSSWPLKRDIEFRWLNLFERAKFDFYHRTPFFGISSQGGAEQIEHVVHPTFSISLYSISQTSITLNLIDQLSLEV